MSIFPQVSAHIYTSIIQGFWANGQVHVEATDWPAFVYDPASVDPDYVEQGLFTGDLLFNVCHYSCFNVFSLSGSIVLGILRDFVWQECHSHWQVLHELGC